MKKIMMYTIAMAFVLALGSAYAGTLYNGVTDFSGKSYDSLEIAPAPVFHGIEGSSTGGARVADSPKALFNGATDFSGKSYDDLEIAPAPVASVEGSSTGGMRAADPKELHNGITDFSGRSYDSL